MKNEIKTNILIKKTFMYDEFSDSLMIFNIRNKDPVIGSVNVLNLIVDLTANSQIANIEIKHISDYLEEIGINPNILKKLDDAKISIKPVRNGYLIYFLLKYDNKIRRIPYNIQTREKAILV